MQTVEKLRFVASFLTAHPTLPEPYSVNVYDSGEPGVTWRSDSDADLDAILAAIEGGAPQWKTYTYADGQASRIVSGWGGGLCVSLVTERVAAELAS
jgi:hypothetical protein